MGFPWFINGLSLFLNGGLEDSQGKGYRLESSHPFVNMEFHSAAQWSARCSHGDKLKWHQRYICDSSTSSISFVSFSNYCVFIFSRLCCHCEQRRRHRPLYVVVSGVYPCNTSNKLHQASHFPAPRTHFIYTASENQRQPVIWDRKKMDVRRVNNMLESPTVDSR